MQFKSDKKAKEYYFKGEKEMKKDDEKVIRVQVCITEGELEVIRCMEQLHNGSVEGALTNGIINQIKEKSK